MFVSFKPYTTSYFIGCDQIAFWGGFPHWNELKYWTHGTYMKHFTWMWYSISMFCFWQIFSSAACDYNCYTENSSPPSEKRGPANGVQSVSNQPTSGSDRQQSALAWVSPSMVAPSQRYPVPPTVYHLWCISIHSNLAVSDRSVETSGGFSAKISTPGDIRVGLLKYGPQRFSWIFLYF